LGCVGGVDYLNLRKGGCGGGGGEATFDS